MSTTRRSGRLVRDLGVAAGIACAGLAWFLGRRSGRPAPPVTPRAGVPARRPTVGVGLEWICLLAGVASRGAGSPLHVFVTVLDGGRTGQHLLRLVLIGASFLLRGLRTGRPIRRSGIEGPVALLLMGQALPHVLMRDGRRYLPKAVRTAAALGLYYAGLEGGRGARATLATGVAISSALLAVQWPTTWRFAEVPAYYGPLQRVGLAINRRVRPLRGPELTKNRAAGVFAAVLPLAVAQARWRTPDGGPRSAVRQVFFAGLAILSGGGLAMTFSRMSWLGAAVGAGIPMLAALRRRWQPSVPTRVLLWASAPPVALAAVRLVRRGSGLPTILRRLSAPTRSFDERSHLARAGVTLVRDYGYTGAGHESLTSLHANYALLHHVPRYSHPHNLYLNTWLEDGLLGALGLAWGGITVLGWAWRASGRADLSPWTAGGFGSLAAIGIMGLAQDYYIHGIKNDYHTADWRRTRILLIPGVLLGVAGALARAGVPDDGGSAGARWIPRLGAPLLAAWAVRRRRVLIAAWHANVAALLQTRFELRRYDPDRFERPLLDEIRRGEGLAGAVARFHRALAWDPGNATALQRLGAIALARGQDDAAAALLGRAWDAGHRDRVTRLLYGDALVAQGRVDEAVAMVRGLELSAARLHFQAWYRYEVRGDHARAIQARRAAALLEAGGDE